MEIEHDDRPTSGAFFVRKDGERVAELVYTRRGPSIVIIEHTEVSDALRGTGTGKKLVEAVVDWARRDGLQVIPRCPFARSVFEKEPGWRDVLAPRGRPPT